MRKVSREGAGVETDDSAEFVGRPFQAADPLSSGSGRLESRLRAGLPAPQAERCPLLGKVSSIGRDRLRHP